MKENTKLVLAIVVFLLISLIILPNIIKKSRADVAKDAPVTNIEEETETPIKVYKHTTGNLNLRIGPGTDYSIILTIPDGEMVEIMENTEGWYKVIYQGEVGYCSSEFLQ